MSSLGYRHTPEAKAKIVAALKGRKRAFRPISTEQKAKISAALTGFVRGPQSAERRAKMSAQLTGRTRSVGASAKAKATLATKATGICDMCHEDKLLNQDHNHVTGKLRGKLCINCNLGLGNFKDNPKLCRDAADYLERWL